MKKKEEKAINEGAEYIILNKDGHKIYVYHVGNYAEIKSQLFSFR